MTRSSDPAPTEKTPRPRHKSYSERLEGLIFAVADFCNAVEAAAVSMREHLKTLGPAEKQWDPSKIKWVRAESASGKGPFQRADPKQGGVDFRNMLQDIKEHGGFLVREGFRYWVFSSDQCTVGRRRKGSTSRKARKGSKKPQVDAEKIRELFPENIAALLMFKTAEDHINITPRQYLGSENFAKIASVVREAGGEYKSQGKESHFEIPVKA